MPQRRAIAFILVTAIAGYSLLTYLILSTLVYPSFEALQVRIAKGDLSRIEAAISTVAEQLDATSIDHAQWDATYAFVSGDNESYPQEMFNEHSYSELDVNLILFFDARGALRWGEAFDLDEHRQLDLDEVLHHPLRPSDPLIRHAAIDRGLRGLLSTRRGPLVVASRPVLTSDAAGPIAGATIFGRFLDARRLEIIRQKTGVDFALLSAAPGAATGAVRDILARLSESGDGIVHEERGELLITYKALQDLYGRSAFVLELRTSRELTSLGLSAVQLATIFILCAGAAFGLILWVVLQHIVRLRRSREEMAQARDAALEVARLKSRFLATMSHEIRTPMNGVLGMTDLLLETRLEADQQRFARTIRESARGLLEIINDILDLSKIEAGKLELDVQDFSIRSLVEDVAALFAAPAHAKGLELLPVMPPDLDAICRGDPIRLRQVLLNLLGNAVKFTKRGEVVIVASIEREGEDGCVVRFEVRDTGIGIPEHAQQQIFDSFTQVDASTSRQFGGTGLGLSICRELVDLMGGTLRVSSEPGRGSTFWFTLRMPRAAGSDGSRMRPADVMKDINVLVVDDNAAVRSSLRDVLASWQMQPTSVARGDAALRELRAAAWRRNPYELAIVDAQLSDLTGSQLALAIADDAALGDIRVIMLDSMVAPTRAEAPARPAAGRLMKPVRQAELYDCIAGVLGGMRASGWTPSDTAAGEEGTQGGRLEAHILVVEDNDVNQMVAVAMLNSVGCTVDVASDGHSALEMIGRGRYDAVLMDCQMPGMNGYQATAEIRRRDARGASGEPLCVIALTANDLEGDRERCLAAGMDDYLSKPFTRGQLLDTLQRWLSPRPDSAT